MNPAQIFILSALAFCPIVILFGPILFQIFKTQEFNLNRHAISTLRDFDVTKVGFLIWINLYMISQVVYTFLSLPFLVEVPTILYILGMTSVVCGVIAFVFLSTTLKHVFFIGISFILTIISLAILAVILFKVDLFFSLFTGLAALVMLSFLSTIPLNRMRIWLAEYLALACLCIWNIVTLVKIIQ